MTLSTWILAFICIAFNVVSSTSGHDTLVVHSGTNVSLSCNLSASEYLIWFKLESLQIHPVITVKPEKLGEGGFVDYHQGYGSQDWDGFGSRGRHGYEGNLQTGSSLEIRDVTEEDSGVYICSSKSGGQMRFNKGVYLKVTGADDSPLPVHGASCWSPGLCLIPGLVSVALLCITVLCFCKSKSSLCCCSKVNEDFSLHYSSLQHLRKYRPSAQADLRLVKEDVIYSTVNNHPKLNPMQRDRCNN